MIFHNKTFLIASIVYLITAVFSVGYIQSDEHYQIIEFAGYISGDNKPSDLAWEFSEQMRPALQPLIAYGVFKICDFFSVIDPYNKTFVLRLVTVILSLSILHFFVRICIEKKIVIHYKAFILISYFLWFLPFLNIRFSSETWSGLFLLYAVGVLVKSEKNYLLAGILLGLSFLFRFQIAFSIFGVFVWLFFIEKEKFLKIVTALSGVAFMVLVGIIIDSWFYGKLTITPINYFISNIIDDKASTFGTLPWYYYFFLIFRYSLIPIGLIILFSFFTFLYKKPKHILVWVIVPFFIGHSLVSHKELRFLFPLINFLPLIIMMSFEVVAGNNWNPKVRKIVSGAIILVVVLNVFGLIIAAFSPAGVGIARITKSIHRINNKDKLLVVHSEGYNPYRPWGIRTNFYEEKNMSVQSLDGYLNNHENLIDENTQLVFVLSEKDINSSQVNHLLDNNNSKEVCKSKPSFLIPFLKMYGYKTKDILTVYSN